MYQTHQTLPYHPLVTCPTYLYTIIYSQLSDIQGINLDPLVLITNPILYDLNLYQREVIEGLSFILEYALHKFY